MYECIDKCHYYYFLSMACIGPVGLKHNLGQIDSSTMQ